MTGFLKLDLLRAHEAPWSWRMKRPDVARLPLVARWECDSDRRLVCRWRIDDKTEPSSFLQLGSMVAPPDHDPHCRRPGDVS
jgi:hypothetical protein